MTLSETPPLSCCKAVSINDLFLVSVFSSTKKAWESSTTLSKVGVGSEVKIRMLDGPGCDRLRDMGLCEELQVRKLSAGRNLICSVCGTRLAISKELADQVIVEKVE